MGYSLATRILTTGARIMLALLCAGALPTRGLADVTELPAEQRTALLDSARFEEIHVTAKVPKAIVALCTGGSDRMADPGQRWEPTDVISGPPLPNKRLIWAAVTGSRYVVHYERGGIGFSYHVLVATLGAGDAPPESHLARRGRSVPGLRRLCRRPAPRETGRSSGLRPLSAAREEPGCGFSQGVARPSHRRNRASLARCVVNRDAPCQ
jgi:hypothetical protein